MQQELSNLCALNSLYREMLHGSHVDQAYTTRMETLASQQATQLGNCRIQNSFMEDRSGALSRVACTIYFIISGTLRAGAHTLKELISAGRKTCNEGLFAELRGAHVLFFIQQAGLINEIFGEDCAVLVHASRRVEW